MNPTDANAIADYLKDGGQISKMDEVVPATVQEVIAYLATCGHQAKYFPGDMKPYLCNGKRYALGALFALANEHRRAHALPLFALRS